MPSLTRILSFLLELEDREAHGAQATKWHVEPALTCCGRGVGIYKGKRAVEPRPTREPAVWHANEPSPVPQWVGAGARVPNDSN